MNSQSPVHPESTRIGWIGTGVMGRSMCGHILQAGYQVSVFNRTETKTESLVQRGARACSSPREVALQSDIVFSMVGFPADVEQVLLGEDGALAGLSPGGLLVDMSTSSPGLAQRIASEAVEKDCFALDAPVSGGDIGAREARLSIMVGGDQAQFERLAPLWKLLGKTFVYQGPSGSGQHTKMVNQILVAASMVGLCEALLYATESGLNPETVLESVSSGAAGSWSLTNLMPRLLKEDYSPGFFVDHFVKDLGIVLDEARKMQIELPGVELAERLYKKTQSMGLGSNGTQALYKAISNHSH